MAKSNAERQAEYRAKQRLETDKHQLNTFIGHDAWTRLVTLAEKMQMSNTEVIETLLSNACPNVEIKPKELRSGVTEKLETLGQERMFE